MQFPEFPRRELMPWCRFSDTCYMRDIEHHIVTPPVYADDQTPYAAGCPKDENGCRTAQVFIGNVKLFEQKKCLECGKLFDPPGHFCSPECENAYTTKPRKCAVCGKEFTSKFVYKATCSRECAKEYERERERQRRMG